MLRYILVLKNHIKELAQAYDKIAEGNYNIRISSNLSGNLGKAGKSFNLMTEDINKNIETLKDRSSKLKAILKSISNGIIAIDSEENIMLMNRASQTIFDYKDFDYEGVPLTKIIKNKRMLDSILGLVYLRKSKETELEIDGTYYKINVDPIKMDDNKKIIIGSIINIEDVTDKVRLERMRSDFVANVTHELKTPLTSINGFVETLKSNSGINKATRMRFLEIIEMESNRLQRLIDDILTLSFIENNQSSKTSNEVNIVDIVKNTINLMDNMAKAKEISIDFNYNKDEILINCQHDILTQLVLNLLDNAVKYSNPGGQIKINLLKSAGKILFSIHDDGIGIPQEDISRVFERFYRVDKARSQKAGGTGLGLAIVKHIVISLSGKIKVNSEVGKYTEFIVEIPLVDQDKD